MVFFSLVFFHYSNVPNSTGFQQMARMMDSLILNEFPPYTFTKITTSHRPTRTNNGLGAKLLNKSTAAISPTGLTNNLRPNLQKPKVPLQGKYTILRRSSAYLIEGGCMSSLANVDDIESETPSLLSNIDLCLQLLVRTEYR